MPAIHAVADLYAYAIAFERQAAGRYRELALRMKSLGHEAVAELLGALAEFENDHLRALESRSAGLALPAVVLPETPGADVADLFMPRQVLAVALEAEHRSYAFYENVVMTAVDAAVRDMAREMALEEAEHIALIERLLPIPASRRRGPA